MNGIFDIAQGLSPAAGAVIGFVVGLLLGLVHFATLKRVAVLYTSGGGIGKALALQLARFALLAFVMIGVAQLGPMPLIAAAAGMLAGRWVVLRRNREAG